MQGPALPHRRTPLISPSLTKASLAVGNPLQARHRHSPQHLCFRQVCSISRLIVTWLQGGFPLHWDLANWMFRSNHLVEPGKHPPARSADITKVTQKRAAVRSSVTIAEPMSKVPPLFAADLPQPKAPGQGRSEPTTAPHASSVPTPTWIFGASAANKPFVAGKHATQPAFELLSDQSFTRSAIV